MTNDKRNTDGFDNLTQLLIEDILETSDEDILAEIREEGGDATRIAEATFKLFERAKFNVAKSNLHAAKTAVAANRQRSGNVVRLNPQEARKKLETFIAKSPETAKKLTLAARNEQGLSDEDIRGMLEDLEDLGINLSAESNGGK